MLRQTLGIMRELPRLHEIASVFIRHGLGEFVQRIGIAGVLERAGQILHRAPVADQVTLDPATRMRMALEELGPTFVKLGQVMATRVDLFPPRWIAEFEKLHAEVPPVPFEALLPELTQSLGRAPFEVFRDIDTRARGAASIAQVHRAKLEDGTPVVLKVRRPGVRETIDADLRLLRRVSDLIESEIPEARRYRPAEIAEQFAKSLEREADFAVETRNIERFAQNFAGDPYIVIPRIYPEYTSDVLLVQEHVAGIPATDIAAVEREGLDKKLLAARGVEYLAAPVSGNAKVIKAELGRKVVVASALKGVTDAIMNNLEAITRDEARGVMLAAQGLFDPPAAVPDERAVRRTIDRLGVVQLDAINVVARSPYLVLHSRLGPYDPAALDAALGQHLPPLDGWAYRKPFCTPESQPIFAMFLQKFFRLSVPPNNVVKIVESAIRMCPARSSFGGIQMQELNSVLPAAVKGCSRSRSMGWRANT